MGNDALDTRESFVNHFDKRCRFEWIIDTGKILMGECDAMNLNLAVRIEACEYCFLVVRCMHFNFNQ